MLQRPELFVDYSVIRDLDILESGTGDAGEPRGLTIDAVASRSCARFRAPGPRSRCHGTFTLRPWTGYSSPRAGTISSAGQRDRALKNYQHYMELPPQKRRDIDQHYEKWKKLPRSDQDRFRKKHDEYRGKGLVGDD